MEIMTIQSFSAKLTKDSDKLKRSCIYCVLKSADSKFVSKNCEASSKDWNQLIDCKEPYQIQIPRSHHLFKLQIWNYDDRQILGETNVSNSDLPINQRQKQFSINDRKIHLKFIYQRKPKPEQIRQSENSTLRVSYNKSDPNLKILPSKPTTAYIRRNPNPMQEVQNIPKYDSSSFGRWKFIPGRNDSVSQKLRL